MISETYQVSDEEYKDPELECNAPAHLMVTRCLGIERAMRDN